jgi:hypothetical protein
MCIPDPADPDFSITDPGSKRHRIPNPDPQQRIYVFLTQKIVTKLSEILSRMFIQGMGLCRGMANCQPVIAQSITQGTLQSLAGGGPGGWVWNQA